MAINRASQNWPEEVTLTLVEYKGEKKPFGRLRAMQMLLEKSEGDDGKTRVS